MKKTLALVLAVGAAGIVVTAGSAGPTERSGALHVTKNCRDYHGLAGEVCTITSSNINAIKPGSRIVYASAVSNPTPGMFVLDSDLVLDGPGNNSAFGHVVLNVLTLTGTVTLSGGTGVFTHFHAGPINVACPAFPDCSWDGPYSFSPHD
jgi:hypothetical protein